MDDVYALNDAALQQQQQQQVAEVSASEKQTWHPAHLECQCQCQLAATVYLMRSQTQLTSNLAAATNDMVGSV